MKKLLKDAIVQLAQKQIHITKHKKKYKIFNNSGREIQYSFCDGVYTIHVSLGQYANSIKQNTVMCATQRELSKHVYSISLVLNNK